MTHLDVGESGLHGHPRRHAPALPPTRRGEMGPALIGTGGRPTASEQFRLAPAVVAVTLYVLGLLAVAIVGWGNGWPLREPAWLLLAIGGYSGMRIAWEIGRGADRWFFLAFHSFVYVFLAIAPLAQVSSGILLWAVDPSESTVLVAALICAGGVLLFDVAALVTASRAPRAVLDSADEADATRTIDRYALGPPPGLYGPQAARRIIVTLLFVALLGLAVFIRIGGLTVALASRAQMDAVLCGPTVTGDLAGCGIVNAIVRVPVAMLLVAVLGLPNTSRIWWGRVALAVAVIGTFMTANPVSSARFWSGAVLIGVIGALSRNHRTLRVSFWLALPLALLVVFPEADFARLQSWTSNFGLQPQLLVQKQDYDAFQQVMNGVTYVSRFGTRDGAQLLTSLLFFVPRSIWTAKALPTGTLVTSLLGITYNNNVSAPLWEEAYVDFGIAGVVVILSLAGATVGWLERSLESSVGAFRAMRLVGPFLAGYTVYLLRGSLLPAMGILATSLALTATIAVVGRERSAVRRRPSTGWAHEAAIGAPHGQRGAIGHRREPVQPASSALQVEQGDERPIESHNRSERKLGRLTPARDE